MAHLNIEIKARHEFPGRVRAYLERKGAEFRGTDHQTDTYFNVPGGRLKLREGNIENNLIYYHRNNEAGARESRFSLINVHGAGNLKALLTQSLGVKIIVVKKRDIFFIENVKFHVDEVAGLGSFVEIEASNLFANVPVEKLGEQCTFYMKELAIGEERLVAVSYCDMLLSAGKQ